MKVICIYIFTYFDSDVNAEESVSASQKMRASMIPLGISYIAATLKNTGNETMIIPFSDETKLDDFITDIENADLFCISLNYYNCISIAEKLTGFLKKINPNKKIIVGGSIATLYPDKILKNKNIDALCLGDGERAIINYVNAVKNNELNKEIDNIFIRQNDDTILKCKEITFVEDIDSLPFVDRHMWDRWIFDTTQHKILIERGCPYKCAYCANHRFAGISSGNYLRYRNIDSIISELEYVLREYPHTESFMLYAENIASDNERFFNLCVALKEFNLKINRQINFAIILNVTKKIIRETKIFDAMKEANIKWVMFGFESASKEIRNKLNRPKYDNMDILRFCRQMQNRNIHITIYAMYCYPYETNKTYTETVKWLKFFRPDDIGYATMLLVEGSELYNRFFIRNEEKYNENLFFKIISGWRVKTLKLRVYITYKPFFETLFWFLKQFRLGSKFFFIWRFYTDFRKKQIDTYIRKCKIYFDNEDFKKAVKYLNKIESLGDSWIFADRAFANFKLGKKQEALKDINTALKLEKDNKNYHNLRDEIIKYK